MRWQKPSSTVASPWKVPTRSLLPWTPLLLEKMRPGLQFPSLDLAHVGSRELPLPLFVKNTQTFCLGIDSLSFWKSWWESPVSSLLVSFPRANGQAYWALSRTRLESVCWCSPLVCPHRKICSVFGHFQAGSPLENDGSPILVKSQS